ncbi:hypothetical protein [Streptomyces cavernae]|uniref:hypothetical protein n=1 Tax=Streptomyces cavernae TaxID=2259034 RepID=UPI00192E4E45|nr:hypothetical protein [Streptomyces cavernae]
MGRKKPGKPGRRRSGAYTLQQLQPPGYDEWLSIGPDFTSEAAADDPRLSDDAIDLMQRLARLRPQYAGAVPKQAVALDMALDTGSLPFCLGGEKVTLVPLHEVASALGADTTGDLRSSFHQLHSIGALLVDEAGDVPLVRIVTQRPQRPGDPWIFHGSPEDKLVPKTCIPAQPGDLPADEFAALAFVRSHMSRGTEATPEEFAEHEGVGSVGRARDLFAAVAELATVRGCPACPSAHICTRLEPDGAES